MTDGAIALLFYLTGAIQFYLGWAAPLAIPIWAFVNTNFTTALMGAFAGAFGATWIFRRTEERKRLFEQLRFIQSTVSSVNLVTQHFLSTKKQLLVPLKNNFAEIEGLYDQLARQQVAEPQIEFPIDFQQLPKIKVPIEELKDLAFHQLEFASPVQTLIQQLDTTVEQYNRAVTNRNQKVNQFETMNTHELAFIQQHFLGRPDDIGNANTAFPDIMNSLLTSADDAIYFSIKCSDCLVQIGKAIKKKLNVEEYKIVHMNLDPEELDDLLPDKAPFIDWEKNLEFALEQNLKNLNS
jgi:hypothetical protein